MPPKPRRVRFRVPWSIDQRAESFVVRDADGFPLCNIYFEDGEGVRSAAMQRLTKDEARQLANDIERIPELLQIEKMAKSSERDL